MIAFFDKDINLCVICKTRTGEIMAPTIGTVAQSAAARRLTWLPKLHITGRDVIAQRDRITGRDSIMWA